MKQRKTRRVSRVQNSTQNVNSLNNLIFTSINKPFIFRTMFNKPCATLTWLTVQTRSPKTRRFYTYLRTVLPRKFEAIATGTYRGSRKSMTAKNRLYTYSFHVLQQSICYPSLTYVKDTAFGSHQLATEAAPTQFIEL